MILYDDPIAAGLSRPQPPANMLGLAQAGVACGAEVQHLQVRLDLYNESIVLTQYHQGRPLQSFEVDPTDLAAAFGGLAFSSGLLPPDCLAYARVGGQERLVVYRPPQRATLTVTRKAAPPGDQTQSQYTIPLPGLVFRGHGAEYAVFAVRERPAALTAPLYHAPFPNVYPDGRICQGTATFPAARAATIHAAARVFLGGSRFNRDLSQGKSGQYPQDVTRLWADLDQAGATEFPLADLQPTRQTLADLVDNHQGGCYD
jgi:PRTRC genetic system protein B